MLIKIIFFIFIKYNFVIFKNNNFFWKKKINLQLFFFSKTFINKIFLRKKYYYTFVKIKNFNNVVVNPHKIRRYYRLKRSIAEARVLKSRFITFKNNKKKTNKLRKIWNIAVFVRKRKRVARKNFLFYKNVKAPRQKFFIVSKGYRARSRYYIRKRRKYYFAHKKYAPHLLTLGEVVYDKLAKTIWNSPLNEKIAKNYLYFLVKRKRRYFTASQSHQEVKNFAFKVLKNIIVNKKDNFANVKRKYKFFVKSFKWALTKKPFFKNSFELNDLFSLGKLERDLVLFDLKNNFVKHKFSPLLDGSLYKNMIKFYLKTSNKSSNFLNYNKFIRRFKQSFIVKKIFRRRKYVDIKAFKISNLFNQVLSKSFKRKFKFPKFFYLNKSWKIDKNKKNFLTILQSVSKKNLVKKKFFKIKNFRKLYRNKLSSFGLSGKGLSKYKVKKLSGVYGSKDKVLRKFKRRTWRHMRFKNYLNYQSLFLKPFKLKTMRNRWKSFNYRKPSVNSSLSVHVLRNPDLLNKNSNFAKSIKFFNYYYSATHSSPSAVKNFLLSNFFLKTNKFLMRYPNKYYNSNVLYKHFILKKLRFRHKKFNLNLKKFLFYFKSSAYNNFQTASIKYSKKNSSRSALKKEFKKFKRIPNKKYEKFFIKKKIRTSDSKFWRKYPQTFNITSTKLLCFLKERIDSRPIKFSLPTFFSFLRNRKFLTNSFVRFRKLLKKNRAKVKISSFFSFANKFLFYKKFGDRRRLKRNKDIKKIKKSFNLFNSSYFFIKNPSFMRAANPFGVKFKKSFLTNFSSKNMINSLITNRRNSFVILRKIWQYKKFFKKSKKKWWQKRRFFRKHWSKYIYFGTSRKISLLKNSLCEVRLKFPKTLEMIIKSKNRFGQGNDYSVNVGEKLYSAGRVRKRFSFYNFYFGKFSSPKFHKSRFSLRHYLKKINRKRIFKRMFFFNKFKKLILFNKKLRQKNKLRSFVKTFVSIKKKRPRKLPKFFNKNYFKRKTKKYKIIKKKFFFLNNIFKKITPIKNRKSPFYRRVMAYPLKKNKVFLNRNSKFYSNLSKNNYYFKNYFKHYTNKSFVKNSLKSGYVEKIFVKSNYNNFSLSWLNSQNLYYKLSMIDNKFDNLKFSSGSNIGVKTINFFLKNSSDIKQYFNDFKVANKVRLFKNYFKKKTFLKMRNHINLLVSNKINILQNSSLLEEFFLKHRKLSYFKRSATNIKHFIFFSDFKTRKRSVSLEDPIKLVDLKRKFRSHKLWTSCLKYKFDVLENKFLNKNVFEKNLVNLNNKRYQFFKKKKFVKKLSYIKNKLAAKQDRLAFPLSLKFKERFLPNHLHSTTETLNFYKYRNKYLDNLKVKARTKFILSFRPVWTAKLPVFLKAPKFARSKTKKLSSKLGKSVRGLDIKTKTKEIHEIKHIIANRKLRYIFLKRPNDKYLSQFKHLDLFVDLRGGDNLFSPDHSNGLINRLKNNFFTGTFNKIYRYNFDRDDEEFSYRMFDTKRNRIAYRAITSFVYNKYNFKKFRLTYYNAHSLRYSKKRREKYSKRYPFRKIFANNVNWLFSSRRAYSHFFKSYNIKKREGIFRILYFRLFKERSIKKNLLFDDYNGKFKFFRKKNDMVPVLFKDDKISFLKRYAFKFKAKNKNEYTYFRKKSTVKFNNSSQLKIFSKKNFKNISNFSFNLFKLESKKFVRLNKYKNRIFYHIFSKKYNVGFRKKVFAKKRDKRVWAPRFVTFPRRRIARKKGERIRPPLFYPNYASRLIQIKHKSFKIFRNSLIDDIGGLNSHASLVHNILKKAKIFRKSKKLHVKQFLKKTKFVRNQLEAKVSDPEKRAFILAKKKRVNSFIRKNMVLDWAQSYFNRNFFYRPKKYFKENIFSIKSVYKNSIFVYNNFGKILKKNKFFKKIKTMYARDMFFLKSKNLQFNRLEKNYIKLMLREGYSFYNSIDTNFKLDLKSFKKCVFRLRVLLGKKRNFLLNDQKIERRETYALAPELDPFTRYFRVVLKRTKWVYFIGLFDYNNKMVIHFDYLSLNIKFSKKIRVNFYKVWNRMIFLFYVELLKNKIFNITEIYYYKRNRRKNKIRLSWVKMFVRHHIQAFRCNFADEKIHRINKFSFSKKTTKNKKMKR